MAIKTTIANDGSIILDLEGMNNLIKTIATTVIDDNDLEIEGDVDGILKNQNLKRIEILSSYHNMTLMKQNLSLALTGKTQGSEKSNVCNDFSVAICGENKGSKDNSLTRQFAEVSRSIEEIALRIDYWSVKADIVSSSVMAGGSAAEPSAVMKQKHPNLYSAMRKSEDDIAFSILKDDKYSADDGSAAFTDNGV